MALETKVARDLLPLVNDPNYFDRLKAFAEGELISLRKQLETANEMTYVKYIQGQIHFCHRLLNLNIEATQDAKRKE